MKKFGVGAILSIAAFGAILLLSPQGAYADSVNLLYTPSGDAHSGTGAGASYIYPYYFTVTSGSTVTTGVPLMCLSYEADIEPSESWTATISPISQFTGSALTNFEEAAYIFSQTSTLGAVITQWADWELLDPGDTLLEDTVAGLSTADQNAISALLANQTTPGSAAYFVANDPSSPIYSEYVIYVPAAGSQLPFADGDPQILIGDAPVPEPSSLVLLGSGLLGLAACFYWRKRSSSKSLSVGA